jgi:hypothetical protein
MGCHTDKSNPLARSISVARSMAEIPTKFGTPRLDRYGQ